MDRIVRDVSRDAKGDEAPEGFSSYSAEKNIILLGEPGSGKTTLFTDSASHVSARYLTARSFLNRSADELRTSKCIFIDALDEKRAGRGDSNTVDALVQKLLEIKPDQVRLSCRVADWLGETDLAALSDYFDSNGGVRVLKLEALSRTEQVSILQEKGVADPRPFLDEAVKRGLDDLLKNPQNLIMVWQVVDGGSWPVSKRDLFERSVRILLAEHNQSHMGKPTGQFTADELLDAAGGLLAIRLIGDVAGISTQSVPVANDCPSYRQLPVGAMDAVQACLTRRLFVQTDLNGVVDYAHRTIAEYVAARWLASRVNSGLSIRRLLGLIGRDWKPATELRGLYAWLPVVLPHAADLLIEGDPLGILAYGDPASLTVNARKALLGALERLSEIDPWFRKDHWRMDLGLGLSSKHLEEEFAKILSGSSANYSLRSVVLDAISLGPELLSLKPVLHQIAMNRDAPYAERERALFVLCNWDPNGTQRLFEAIKPSADGLRLKVALLAGNQQPWVKSHHFFTLLNQILRLPERGAFGSYWRLSDLVPESELLPVLHSIRPPRSRGHRTFDGRYEAMGIIDRLMIRAIPLMPTTSGSELIRLLMLRKKLSEKYGEGDSKGLREVLAADQVVLSSIAEAVVKHIDKHNLRSYVDWFNLQSALLGCARSEPLIDAALTSIERQEVQHRPAVYEFAVTVAMQTDQLPNALCQRIIATGDEDHELCEIWRRNQCQEIPAWRIEESVRNAERAIEEEVSKAQRCADFDRDTPTIRKGEHHGWATWLGSIYCGRSNFKGQTPEGNLEKAFGRERLDIALQGLIAYAVRNAPTVGEVLNLNSKGKYRPSWFPFIAGVDLLSRGGGGAHLVPGVDMKAALAIDVLHRSFAGGDGSISPIKWAWRKGMEDSDPDLVCSVLYEIATRALTEGRGNDAIHELLSNDGLGSSRAAKAVRLLRELPDAPIAALDQLLPFLANDSNEVRLSRLAVEAYGACRAARLDEHRMRWAVFGHMTNPGLFARCLGEHFDDKRVIWTFRTIGAHKRLSWEDENDYINRVFLIAFHGMSLFHEHGHPQGGWSGDSNPWDASDYLKKTIGHLATIPSKKASDCLKELSGVADMNGYADYIKHIRAEHSRLLIDSEYRQPTWNEAGAGLLALVPHDAATLHAALVDELEYLEKSVPAANTDRYKRYWNEDKYGRVVSPKTEESARDVLVDELRTRMSPLGVAVEPEGHMANDNRADIVAQLASAKIVVELKRDVHSEIWTAMSGQLDRLYTRDPDAKGYGVYGVFWYGKPDSIPAPPDKLPRPSSAEELKKMLQMLLPERAKHRIGIVVIDVSGKV